MKSDRLSPDDVVLDGDELRLAQCLFYRFLLVVSWLLVLYPPASASKLPRQRCLAAGGTVRAVGSGWLWALGLAGWPILHFARCTSRSTHYALRSTHYALRSTLYALPSALCPLPSALCIKLFSYRHSECLSDLGIEPIVHKHGSILLGTNAWSPGIGFLDF